MLTTEIGQYLDWKAEHTAQAAKTYAVHLARLDEFCHKNLEDITIADISAFKHHLRKRFAASNVAYSTTVIKNFFKYYICQNRKCVDPYLIKVPKHARNPHTPLDLNEFIKMDLLVGESNFFELERKIIHRLLWETGLRISELCGINIADLDLKQHAVRVKNKKNAESRWVIWTQETNRFLVKYLGARLCLNQYPALFIASGDSTKRLRVTPRTVQRWIKDLLKRAEIKKSISPHGYRHGKALEMIEQPDGSLKDIQDQLGHQTISSTEWYLNFSRATSQRRAKPYLERTRAAYALVDKPVVKEKKPLYTR